MKLVIDQSEFRRLSESTQRELLERIAGRPLRGRGERQRRAAGYAPRTPFDLGAELATQLMRGLAENHVRRLQRFARSDDGRVSLRALLRVTMDRDPRVLSYFQSVLTRKLRRILGAGGRQAYLIGWDYDSTRWNREHTRIVDGVYYVSPITHASLRGYFRIG